MNRRAFVFASLAAVPALSGASSPARADSNVDVLYIGGQDCPPCRRWRASYHNKWLASHEFQKVDWFEIEPMHLKEAYDERHWPRGLRAVLAQVPRKSGTPRFLIVNDGKIVSNHLGVSSWLKTLADLKQYLE
jgi:hypothetical protein